MRFDDRSDAGRRLAAALQGYTGGKAVVLALPRGGVPVAAEVAAALNAPLDLILVRKVGLPSQRELAMGAVVDGDEPIMVRNAAVIRAAGICEATFEAAARHELAEIERRRRLYLGNRPRPELAGRTVIVVDDGIATGATVRAALKAVRRSGPKEIVLAVPVAPPDVVGTLSRDADRIVCLSSPADFIAVGNHYRDFRQIEDDEVTATLARFPPEVAEKN